MDFFTDLMGLLLLIICILIVLIFLKDYIRIGRRTAAANVNKVQRMINYKVYYKNKLVKQGDISDDQLPFQFGRNDGNGNDVAIVPKDTPEEDAKSVSRAWFFIQKDVMGNYVLYSAEQSGDGTRRLSQRKKLVVADGSGWKAMRTAELQAELQLKAEQFQVILEVENPEDM